MSELPRYVKPPIKRDLNISIGPEQRAELTAFLEANPANAMPGYNQTGAGSPSTNLLQKYSTECCDKGGVHC